MNRLFLSLSISLLLAFVSCGNAETNGKKDLKETASKNATGTIHITRTDFINKIADYTKGDEIKYLGSKPCIIDFYADWCGPCKVAAPIMEELAKEYEGKIIIYKVNTGSERQLASELGIQSIPTFIFFPMEGKPFSKMGIGRSKEETKKMFKDIIDNELLKTKK